MNSATIMKLPSVRDILREEERVREIFKESKNVEKALKNTKFLPPHEVLRICAEEKLKSLGYKIIKRDEAPDWIKKVGSPDIIAEKDGKFVIAEVKYSRQLERYSKAKKARFIIVTNVEEGSEVDVWGIKELEEI